jgi:hypothetical protein
MRTQALTLACDVSRATGCAKEVTVLLWPDGHPAVPGISFPSLRMHRGREELGAPLRAGFLRALGSAGAVDVRSRATRCEP